MAAGTQTFSTPVTASKEANLASLADNALKVIDVIDNSSVLAFDYEIEIKAKLAAAGVDTVAGAVNVYVCVSKDGTLYTDNIDETSDADQSAGVKNAFSMFRLTADVNSQQIYIVASIVASIGWCPEYFLIAVENASGASFLGTDYAASHKAFGPTA